MNIRAVIFDNDGLLQDTEKDYEWAFTDMARSHGCIPPSRDLLMRVKGVDLQLVAQMMIDELALPLQVYEQFKQELDTRLAERAPFAEMMPDAERLVRRLKEAHYRLAVATSSTAEVLRLKTAHHQSIYNHFDCVVAGDDPEVRRGKPHPDILLVCAKRLGVAPEDCAYVGDNPVDVQAALAANMFAIAVPLPGRSPTEFQDAHLVLNSLYDFPL